MRLAGLEFQLPAGFKTYWRAPGDSGVPPLFDWSRSENIERVDVLWPVPHRFGDSAGSSIGYSGELILPLKVKLRDPDKSASLILLLDYAICERLCVPAKGQARLDLPAGIGGTAHSARIAAFSARTPVPAPSGAGSAPGIVQIAAAPDGQAITVEALVPATAVTDLFVEGPEGWIFGSPTPLESRKAGADALAVRYRVPIEAKPDQGRLSRLDVVLTLASGDQAVETRGRLDVEDVRR